MKVIIVGLGRTGCQLVKYLSNTDYDITVIDKEKKLVDKVTDRYNVNGIVGSGASRETLIAAGAEIADAIVAMTHVDEINLLSCMQAKSLGTLRAAARILHPDFVNEQEDLKKEYKIDYLIKPKSDMAEEIYRNIGMPGYMKFEGFWEDNVQMINLNVLDDSPVKDKTLAQIRQSVSSDFLVTTVIRGDKLYIPDGSFVIKEGDSIDITADKKNIGGVLDRLGISKCKADRIVIAGCGATGEFLLDMLIKYRASITVLEDDPEQCRHLMQKYESVKVICSQDEIIDVLEEEKVSDADVMISLTDNDETNLVISMYAWSSGIPSVITRVDKPEHVKLLHKVNIDITVSPTELSALKMLRFLRNHEMDGEDNEIGKFYHAAEGRAEIMEFVAGNGCMHLDTAFADKAFALKKDVLIAAIIRDGAPIIPSGSSVIKAGDRVIVASSKKNHIRNINEIFTS
ncbi:MAG: Trk system potassium transporter TrkA [Lachnospiraceae bacterium]|nr:Trk system potassium transporter TrkA [Lachnospiraceae bacterium]